MRIVMAQLDYKIGAFSANFEKMQQAVSSAREQGSDLVVFSELATTGYAPGDLLEREDFVERNLEQLDRIADLTDEDLGVLVGYVDRNRSGEGKALYNAAALCHRGRVVERAIKCLLPTYDVFDEARYFEPGGEVRPMDFKGVRLGVTICEDVWADPELWDRRLYRRDPVRELVDRRAQVLINLSASPFALGKTSQRRELVRSYASESGRCFFYVNQVGGNDELVFDGHSLVVDGEGDVVVRADDFAEDLLAYELDVEALHDGDDGAKGVAELREVADCDEEEALRALELGVADYLGKSGFSKVVIGLSGGIDSALTAAVAARALGPEKVLGVAMPTRYSSEGSVADARALADNLGIEFRVISIDRMFQTFLDELAPSFDGFEEDVTEENIQARVRGTVLMALSNKLGRLVLATGNKSELAVGYCTLYGDMCGGLAVISDVPKTLVYAISRHINRDGEVIPESTLTKPPSAELRPDQKDEDSLPPYEVLDAILEAYVERHASMAEIIAEGFERAAVEQVVALIDRNEYKRRQAAPGIKITSKAFGTGRRYPIVADYPELHRR
jgi:NAD+ synthetase